MQERVPLWERVITRYFTNRARLPWGLLWRQAKSDPLRSFASQEWCPIAVTRRLSSASAEVGDAITRTAQATRFLHMNTLDVPSGSQATSPKTVQPCFL